MKDPAILFYTSDFLTGTLTMDNEQVGKYIRLLCLQHQKTRLTEKDMLKICGKQDNEIWSKFNQDKKGYFNKRMDEEIKRRRNYSESRRRNRAGKKKEYMNKICETYVNHMETETEIENLNINILLENEELTEKSKQLIKITKALHVKLLKISPDNYEIKHAKWGEWLKKVRPFINDRKYTVEQFQNVWNYIDNKSFYRETITTLDTFLNNFEKIKSEYLKHVR